MRAELICQIDMQPDGDTRKRKDVTVLEDMAGGGGGGGGGGSNPDGLNEQKGEPRGRQDFMIALS